MKNAKGFTLVELLAVIVILAIVALVTTPAILNVINNSRVEGAKDKAWGTIDAVRLAYTQAQTAGYEEATDTNAGITYTANASKTGGTIAVDFSKGEAVAFGTKKVTYSGDKPVSGTVTINTETGAITASNLKFTGNGTYTCSTTDGKTMSCNRA